MKKLLITIAMFTLFSCTVYAQLPPKSKAQDFIFTYEILYQNAGDSMIANKKDAFKMATWFLVQNAYADSLSKYFDIRLAELRQELKQTMFTIEFKNSVNQLIGVNETLKKTKQ